jgi:tripartite-type tricarboxylate transporter receptor subunit TctC
MSDKANLLQRRHLLKLGATALATLGHDHLAWADAWPAKPVTCVVPFPAGGGTDAFARPFSVAFTKISGQNLILDYRGGAGGTLGATIASRAQPDGYNFFMGAVHHAIAPSMYPKLDYNLDRDFIPLALMATVPFVLVVNPKKVPATDFKSFIEQLRSNPGKLNFGSAGSGTAHHLAGELFKLQTRTDITHIPYKGAGPALQDLAAGNIDMMFDGLGSSAQHIKSGRIKAVLVAGSQRNAAFPEVPCAAELGLKDYNVSTWYGMWAPRGTSVQAQNGMLDVIKKSMDAAEVKTSWASNGADFPSLSGVQFADFIAAETKRWASVVKASGAKLD